MWIFFFLNMNSYLELWLLDSVGEGEGGMFPENFESYFLTLKNFKAMIFPSEKNVFLFVPKYFTWLPLTFHPWPLWNYCLYAVNGGDQILPPIKHLTLVFGSPDFSYCCVFQMFEPFYVSLALSPVLSVTI